MKTVQVALRDSEQARSLRDLLVGDGGHLVHLVERPDIAMSGVIVTDIDGLHTCGTLAQVRERLIVMAPKAEADLASVWEAGVRHVVFRGDAPQTVRVAVLATELSLAARF